MNRSRVLFAAISTALLTGALACDGGGTAELEVRITDAPSDYIDSAEIWVSRAYLQGGADTETAQEGTDDEGGRVDLFNDPDNPQQFDLLTLQDGVSASLNGLVTIPEGIYGQLRLVVSAARVTLKPEYQFLDGSQVADLSVPSGASSGIKVQLNGALVAADGTTTTLTVDVPVDDNFVIQGNPDAPEGIQGMTFTPLIHELSREEG